jgi:hypothetical protein
MTHSLRRILSPRQWSPRVKGLVGGAIAAAIYPGVFIFLDFYSGLGDTRHLWHGPLPAVLAFYVSITLGACVGAWIGDFVSMLQIRTRAK